MFWSNKIFFKKIFLKILGPTNFWTQKILGQKIFWVIRILVQKILGQKIVLISQKFDPSKILAPKKEVQKAW